MIQDVDVDNLGFVDAGSLEASLQEGFVAQDSPDLEDPENDVWYNADIQRLQSLIVRCTLCGKSSDQEVPICVNKMTRIDMSTAIILTATS